MALVGDVILTCREQMPDVPQTLTAPAAGPGLTPNATGGQLANGTQLFFVATTVSTWGETTASPETNTTVTSVPNTGSISITGPANGRAYFGISTGSYTGWVQLSAGGTATLINLTGALVTLGMPPSFNTAFNPDSDGSSVGVFTMYRWLNDGIQELSRIAGGILDMTGVQANVLAADYVIPATVPWIRFTDAWFDGYFCQDFKRRNQWRRQFISALTFYWSVEQVNRQMVLNFYPSPNRTGATGTLLNPMGVSDSLIQMTALPAGMLTPGMCIIDNEIMIYSTTSGNNFTGAIRGMGGTLPAAHLAGATVTEFNLVLAGFRQPVTYSVGQAASTLMVPVGWEVPISNFVLARYKNYEQNQAEAMNYYKSFIEEAKRIAFDSRQFPASSAIGGPASFLTLYPGGPFGVIVP